MPTLKLFLLGPPRFDLDGRPVEIGLRKAVALLAYLAVDGQAHSRDQLASLLWPDYEPVHSYAYLRRTIWKLNNVLGKGWLDAGREMVGLAAEQPFWLDAAEFEALLVAENDGREVPADIDGLATAVSLYRGEFMAGFSLSDAAEFDMWQRFTAESLRARYTQALKQLVAEYEARADYQNAIECARRWINDDPLHEPAHRSLMRLYATTGQRAAAIRQYDSLAAILEDELAVPPDPETIALQEQIARGDWPAGRAEETPPAMARPAPRPDTTREIVRLPAQPTPFVGRAEEVAAIVGLLDQPSSRLLSLTGPGGSGKTRLAIRVTEQLVERGHPAVSDGAYFVGLAPLASPDSIGPAIGKSLGGDFYREGTEPRRQLIDYLRHKRLLLILDNFEHLLGEQAITLLADLLAELPELKLLVTSRTRLNVRGESLFPVAGMKAPSQRKGSSRTNGEATITLAEVQSFSSLRLFVQTARQVKPTFELTAQNLPAVAKICQDVQGLPLAIEMAAGWIELLSPAEIAAEIDRCFDILETEARDVPARQRSIRAVFESSWQLLDDQERAMMARLSVFRGGFDRRAAEQVSGATLRNLHSLASKSWLQQNVAGRFQIHELLRQYAHEKLLFDPGEWKEANAQHAAFYTDLMVTAEREMRGPDQLAATDTVALELENISAAWAWHVEQEHFHALEPMLPGLYRYAFTRSAGEEILSLILRALKVIQADPEGPPASECAAILLTFEIRARILISYLPSYQEPVLRVWSYVEQGGGINHYAEWLLLLVEAYTWNVDREEGVRWLTWLADEAQRIGEQWGYAFANLALADLAQADGHYEQASRFAKRAQGTFQKLGDIGMQAHCSRRLGSILWFLTDYHQAEQVLLAGRELFRATADRVGESVILQELHEMSLIAGEFERAFEYFAERRALARALDQRQMIYDSLHWESLQAVRFGDLEHARRLRLESLELAHALDDRIRLAWSMWEMGELLRVEGDLAAARHWYDDALAEFKAADQLQGIAFYHRGLGDIALTEGDFEAARQRFELCLNLSEAEGQLWTIAYALSGLGRAEVALGNLDVARQQFHEAFQHAYIGDLSMVPLYGLATAFAAAGQFERAIELAAFVVSYHMSWHETRRLAAALIEDAGDCIDKDEAEAAFERGRQRDLDSVIADFELQAKGAVNG